jgi:transmembrane sensor
MNKRDEQVREIIAHQAGDWFVAHRAGPLDAAERRAFDAWLVASPVHVEEYLGVARVARNLAEAADDPEMPLETLLERARREGSDEVAPLGIASSSRRMAVSPVHLTHPWRWAAAAATFALVVGTWIWWNGHQPLTERYAVGHGQLKSWRLSDNSIVHLNTDTALTVRYGRAERLAEIDRGEALFEVVHDSLRPFRVVAGTANIVAVGTTFDVYRQVGATLVTVVVGRVEVAATDVRAPTVSAMAGEQVRVATGQPPAHATTADVQRNTAWLRRQIVFEDEPLAQVAAEFNRYSAVPIDVETPALRTLAIGGTFSVDDTESFVEFLRTLDGVSVEVTPSHIRVSKAQ